MPEYPNRFDEIQRLMSAIATDIDSDEAPYPLPSERDARPETVRARRRFTPGAMRFVMLPAALLLVGMLFLGWWRTAVHHPRQTPTAAATPPKAFAAVWQEPTPRREAARRGRAGVAERPNTPLPHNVHADRPKKGSEGSSPARTAQLADGPLRTEAPSGAAPQPDARESSPPTVHLTGAALEKALAEDRVVTQRLNQAELAKTEPKR